MMNGKEAIHAKNRWKTSSSMLSDEDWYKMFISFEYMRKVIKLTENDLTNIVKRVINENMSPREKILKKINSIGLIDTIKLIGYNAFDKILPEYFQDRDNKIKFISEVSEDGISLYEILDSDFEIDVRYEWDAKEADYITYINGEYVTIATYEFDDEGNMIEYPPTDDWTTNLNDLRPEIIDLLFEKMVNKIFK